jgi:Baseplate J-like protein
MRIQLRCGTEGRRVAVKTSQSINGIDYLELIPASTTNDLPLLIVRCFKIVSGINQDNIVVEGGVRIRNIRASWAQNADETIGQPLRDEEKKFVDEIKSHPDARNFLVIRLDSDGDFSTYTLRLVRDLSNNKQLPPVGFDVILSKIDFTFKVSCPNDFDCKQEKICPEQLLGEPTIDYMAKDYASFRTVVRDRLAAIMPEWKEKNPADLGIALVEFLAYIGDHLSYYQDAVATEAYLGTARSRISVRRHARMLDYSLHDGCNARACVCIEVDKNSDGNEIPAGTRLLTGSPDELTTVDEANIQEALNEGAKVFETMHTVKLYSDHNEILFYTWANSNCCLPKGATHATLKDTEKGLKLQIGDILIFEEVRSLSISKEEQEPSHRHAIRLTEVLRKTDELTNTKIVDIVWGPEDALPFPLCLYEAPYHDHTDKEPNLVSIARGNVVLADHGYTVPKEPITNNTMSSGRKFRPLLANKPLTHSGPPFKPSLSAFSAFNHNVREAEPDIHIEERQDDGDIKTWTPVADLLLSDKFKREFVIEMQNDGTAQIRFADDKLDMNPQSKDKIPLLDVVYRIGNGGEGNVGANSITRIVRSGSLDPTGIEKISNPMPARGGIDHEKLDEVRQNAPEAFRTVKRAVTEADYIAVLKQHSEIQRAAASFRWTGSWYTVFVTIDRYGGLSVDEKFKTKIRSFLDNYRLAGYDVELGEPLYVPLEIEMSICIDRNHLAGKVKEALTETLSNRDFGGGRKGFFHPDNFTFGQPVILSKLYESAMSVDGVVSVVVNTFRRRARLDEHGINEGLIKMGSLEIARLDNDPNYPENGQIKFNVEGDR